MDTLIAGLLQPAAYPHAVDAIRLVETHISWVFLTGEYAYKVKKPAALGFLDFSTLAARRHFCEEEVRINRRFAPDLYLGVVPIGGTREAPRFDAPGEPLEYAVRMRQFGAGDLLAERVAAAPLPAATWGVLGTDVAALHARLPRAPADDPERHGVPSLLRDEVSRNFRQVRPYLRDAAELAALNALEEQAWGAWRRLEALMWARYEAGQVRECHGDLHLGNLVLIEGRAVPFDAIEFNAGLRWIDLMNEIGFLVMDCEARGQGEGGFLALNAWLEASGDYEGLPLLDFCCAYRAMVRAKISLLGGAPPVEQGSAAHHDYLRYAALAARFGAPRSRFLALMCGVSGSGKSTLAGMLAGAHRAIRIRSDVERKRLFGLAATDDSHRPGAPDIYTAEAGERTFARLETLAAQVLEGGLPVILDATFIRRGLRERFRALAERIDVPFHVVHCEVPAAELRRRVAARHAHGRDASEADLAVLESQLARYEPPQADSEPGTITVHEHGAATLARLEAALARR